VDLFLLILGGLAFWQLSNSGSFILNRLRQADLADPLLLRPTLHAGISDAGAALFPPVQRVSLAGETHAGWCSLGLSRLSRAPVRPAQVILLISLAAGLIFFTSAYTHTLALAESALAGYRAGADLRVYSSNHQPQDFLALPGVQAVSLMQRIPVNSARGGMINVLAVEPDTLAMVTDYPPGMTNLTIPAVMGALDWHAPEASADQQAANPYTEAVNRDNPIPAVFSLAALGQGQELGSVVELLFPALRVDVKVSGILKDFPTGQGDFIVLDRAALAQYIDLEASQFVRWREVWMRIDPSFYDLLVQTPWVQAGLRADGRQEMLELQSNPFLQGTGRAFALNSAIVSILSVAGLFLVHYFSARQRTYEFGVLRAEGLTAGQLLLLLAGEALLTALIGLGAGMLLGVGLTQGMRAYLNLLLGRVEDGLVLDQVSVDWLAVLRQAGLLVGGYLLATLLSLGMLLQAGVHRVLRIGDE
jgi:hypothetical protein